jgi:hypothetical protein
MIYYGTESGMDGADDPDDRMPMVWEDLQYEDRTIGPYGEAVGPFPIEFCRETFDFYRQLIGLRSEVAAIRRGGLEFLMADDDQKTLLFARRLEQQTVLVVINRSSQASTVSFEPAACGLPSSSRMELLLCSDTLDGSYQLNNGTPLEGGRSSRAGTELASDPKSVKPPRVMQISNQRFQWSVPGCTGQIWELTGLR